MIVWFRCIATVCLGALFLISGMTGFAKADADFDFNARGMTLSGMVGRTMVGVTRDGSSVFSVYLGADGKADFHLSSGRQARATWKREGNPIICFTGLDAQNPSAKACKRAPETGRGLDWMSVNIFYDNGQVTWTRETRDEHRGSSQMVYSFAGNLAVDKASYVADVTKWAGHVIVGRTLKDREAWFMKLAPDGRLDFVFGSGKRFAGRYTLKPGEICLNFTANPELSGCRRPTVRDKKILWASATDGAVASELVFMKKVGAAEKPATAAQTATVAKVNPATQPAADGPREMAVLGAAGSGNVRLLGTADGQILVTLQEKWKQIRLWDAPTGRKIGEIAQIDSVADIDLSADSQRIAVARHDGVEIFSLSTGELQGILARPAGQPDFAQIAFAPTANHIYVGDASGGMALYDFSSGEQLAATRFSAGETTAITNILLSDDGRIVISDAAGRIGVMPPDLATQGDTLADIGSRVNSAAYVKGQIVVTSSDNRLHRVDPAGASLARNVILRNTPASSLRPMPNKDQVVVGMGRKVGFVALSDLSVVGSWNVATAVVRDAVPILRGDGVAVLDRNGRLTIWGRDSATAKKFIDARESNTSPARLRASDLVLRFEKTRTAATRAEQERSKTAEAKFYAGLCDEYAQLLPSVRLANRPAGDCAQMADKRAAASAFLVALRAQDCDAAALLVAQVSNGESRLQTCRANARRAADARALAAALEAGDCDTVRRLAMTVEDAAAGPNCDLAQALASDSPRRMYLAAVQFDTAGDRDRARDIYTAVMTRFPDDDLALDAAKRLTAFADMATMEQRQADQAAQQAAAVKAAEDRARAAEAAAVKAAQEAEKQRKAREDEARRADQARRDAETERARAAAQQQQQQAPPPQPKSAYAVGDTVFTCKYHQDGFMWTSGSYTGCKAIVTQVLGSSFRIEYTQDCDGNYRNQPRILDASYLVPWSGVEKTGWRYTCKASWFK